MFPRPSSAKHLQGSRRFEGVEPLGNSVQVHYISCYHCEDEVREGSVQSNHSELTSKTSTHLSFSALKWFEKFRGGSRGLNHSETVYRYPTHLVTTVKMRFEKVRYSRTTLNSLQRLLYRTFSNLIFTVVTRCVGYLYIELHRTYSKYMI